MKLTAENYFSLENNPISGGIDYDKVIAYRDNRPKRGRPRNKK